MILLTVVTLLFLPSECSNSFNQLSKHSIDSLNLKCDSLPFRSAYVDNRCYFAIFGKIALNDASVLCAAKFSGAKVVTSPVGVHKPLIIDEKLFHGYTNTTEAKNTICVVENGYNCEQGYALVRGKCSFTATKKMTFVDARKYCKKLGLEIPAPQNDLENKVLAGELSPNDRVWVQKTLEKQGSKFIWTGNNYARFTPGDGSSKKGLYAGSQSTGCKAPIAAVIDKSGYWSNANQQTEMSVICTKDAVNSNTKIPTKKEVVQVDGPCVAQHELNEDTGRCDWTGPIDACATLLDLWNHTYHIRMKEGFPEFVYTEECLKGTSNLYFDEQTVKVIVRRGCMFTGYMYPITGDGNQDTRLVEHLRYGIHDVPNYINGWKNYPYGDPLVPTYLQSLTRAACFCDPTEATVGGHVPAPPPNKKCIEHHEFNETTQQCEWTKDPKFCAQITTNDNRMMMLEIPKWPENRIYNVWHESQQPLFANQVVSIIVRQHCFATLIWWHYNQWRPLAPSGYGQYKIPSPYNKMSGNTQGAKRFICECIR